MGKESEKTRMKGLKYRGKRSVKKGGVAGRGYTIQGRIQGAERALPPPPPPLPPKKKEREIEEKEGKEERKGKKEEEEEKKRGKRRRSGGGGKRALTFRLLTVIV